MVLHVAVDELDRTPLQGGGSRELRKRCAEELLTIGFDGFGYGGWPLDGERNLLADILYAVLNPRIRLR